MTKTIPTFDQIHEAIKAALVQCYGTPDGGIPEILNYSQPVPWGDVKILTPDQWRARGEEHGIGDQVLANLIFEGPVYESLNYGGKFADILWKKLEAIGCWFELGNSWNLAVYPTEPIENPTKPQEFEAMTTYGSHKVYTDADLKAETTIILLADALWNALAKKYIAANGDRGTSVIGAGIVVYRQDPGKMPQKHQIIRAPGGQGSLTWEGSVNEIVDLLKFAGIDAWYDPGSMD